MPLTATRPKCLVPVDGRPILRQLLGGLRAAGVDEWVIVVGYRRELIQREVPAWRLDPRPIRWVVNPDYRSSNTLVSVGAAAHQLRGAPFLLLNGDLWIQPDALAALARGSHARALLVDRSVRLDEEAMKVVLDDRGRVCRFGKQLPLAVAAGESVGAYRFDASGGERFLDAVAARVARGDRQAFYEAALDDVAAQGMRLNTVDVAPDTWAEIDDARDLERARALSTAPLRATGS